MVGCERWDGGLTGRGYQERHAAGPRGGDL